MMALVQGVHPTSWRNQDSASSPSDHTPLIELSNALKKLNYDTNSFISNPDFISFLTKELSSIYVYHDTKQIENGAYDKSKDNSLLNLRQNNQSYFNYALLQELLLSWNCYCTINIYPKLNSQEIQHNLVFDTCLGEKQIPDNVASFIKNLLDRGTDLDYIINLLMTIQSGKHIDTSIIQQKQKQIQKKICQPENNINQQINTRKHVHFSSTLCEESNFESEKPILPPKKSTFKNPFKPFLQLKYRPFSKSPFRPSVREQIRPTARPPPPPAPIANTEEIPSTNLSSETSNLSPGLFCPQKNTEENTKFETSSNNKSKKIESAKHEIDGINFIEEDEDISTNCSSVNTQEKYVKSRKMKDIQEKDFINNNDIKVAENSNEKIYSVTKIQPITIEPIAVNDSHNTTECTDSNNNSKITMENNHVIKSENIENSKQINKVIVEDKLAPIAELEPIYDLDLIDNFSGLLSTKNKELVKKVIPPIPPPRKHRRSLLLSQSTTPEIQPIISPIYSHPHSHSLPARPIPPPRKRRSKHSHTLPKSKNSDLEYFSKDLHTTLPKKSKSFSSDFPNSKSQSLLEPEIDEIAIALSNQFQPIPPPRRHRPTAPNDPFNIKTIDSEPKSNSRKFPKKRSLKEQFIKTTESIKNKAISTMSQIYNTCKKIF